MQKKSFKLYSSLLLVGLVLLTVSCGKKSEDSSTPETYTPEVNPQLEEFLSKQEVACENGKPCPEYMVKILVFDADKHHVCTGFLTDPNTVATSSSCLPDRLRLENQDCSKDIFFFFPRLNISSKLSRRGCSKILSVSHFDSNNPVLWRDDLSFLSLDMPLFRRSLPLTREGMPNGKELTMWSVNEDNNYSATIRRDICEVVHNTNFNVLAINEYSPGMTVAGCQFKKGNSGSPLLDSTGQVRGIVTTTVDAEMIAWANNSGLLNTSTLLKPIHNTTNFSCAPTIYDTEVANENECYKEMSIYSIDSARAAMFSINNIFVSQLKALKEEMDKSNKFIKFNVKVNGKDENFQTVEISPKCYKDVPTWIASVKGDVEVKLSPPIKSFRKAMDKYGRIFGQETNSDAEAYSFIFSADRLRYYPDAHLYKKQVVGRERVTVQSYLKFPKCE